MKTFHAFRTLLRVEIIKVDLFIKQSEKEIYFIMWNPREIVTSFVSIYSTTSWKQRTEKEKDEKSSEKQSKKLFDLRAVTMNFSPLCRCLCVFLGKNENCVEFIEMNRHIYYGRGHAERGGCSLFSYQSVYFTDLFAYFCARNVTKSVFPIHKRKHRKKPPAATICVSIGGTLIYIWYIYSYTCLLMYRKFVCQVSLG